uniref:Uncharacterized protein n=1 Tax=Zea mays TaxID=4577 RepID=C4J063_MAIZE|nr:unknown [Zea mays]
MLTMPMLRAMTERSSAARPLDLLTKRPAKPDGFSPNTLKKLQTMKSGRMRERPRVSRSLVPSAQASSATCHPCWCAALIHRYGYRAPVMRDASGNTKRPRPPPPRRRPLASLLRRSAPWILILGQAKVAEATSAPRRRALSAMAPTASLS